MDHQKTSGNDNFLSKLYKNLFSPENNEQKPSELTKTTEILNKQGGIFNTAESKVLSPDSKNNIFNMKTEKTIFNLKDDPLFLRRGKSSGKNVESKEENKLKMPGNNILDIDILKNFKTNKNDPPSGLGKNLDHIG